MPELDERLHRLFEFPGVEQLVLCGRDGLAIRRIGGDESDAESLAAAAPALVQAADVLGTASSSGRLRTAVLELDRGVCIVAALSREVLLAIVVERGVGFASLIHELRSQRQPLLDLL